MSSCLLVRARWDEITRHMPGQEVLTVISGTFFWPLIGWVPMCGWMELATLVHVILL